jgi:hypothetical protein
MAFRNISVSLVANTPVQILLAQAGDVDAWTNVDANDPYYIGGPSVTTSNGLFLSGYSGNTFHTKVRPGDELWAVAPNNGSINILVRSA